MINSARQIKDTLTLKLLTSNSLPNQQCTQVTIVQIV